MKSLALQSEAPDELVIAWMQEAAEPDLPDPGCPVRHVFVAGEALPLAAARNAAARAARGGTLVFLDVDCLASPGLVARYRAAADEHDGLFLGEVLYLPGGAVGAALDFERLDALGLVHPAKPAVPELGLRREPDCGELWGLSFALRARTYAALGGMDESFVGYGAEETDFAHRLGAAGVLLYWTAGARAYHQHHAVHVPPLHHFDAILANAARFRAKHGRWCMEYWLGQMTRSGHIEWDEAAEAIALRRRPSEAEIAAARQPDAVRFS
ncbi:sugar transferase [Aurantimonas sp. Leaf443]|nr:sugar transferase [Aurantimonas sp. Leaf443]